jgi:glycosyltransferase involved in cell wall biosynthesis
MKKRCSVVFCTYNRADLLARSVECYNRSNFPLDDLEIVVVDDASTDNTSEVCGVFDTRIDVKYVRLRKQAGLWRDVGAILNHGIRICTGDNIFLTHPEVLIGRDTLVQFCDRNKYWQYCCAKPYYLSPRDQEQLDTVAWKEKGPLAVREIEGFYDPEQHKDGHPDYNPWAIEGIGKPGGRHPAWESWVGGGFTRQTMKELGGHLVSTKWGTTDILFLNRRRTLGIPNLTMVDDNTLCVHQNHDAPRDIEQTHAEAATFNLTPQNCKYPQINYLW